MKSKFAAVVLMAVVAGSAYAQDTQSWPSAQRARSHSVYQCVGKDSATKTFTDNPSAICRGKKVKKLDLPELTTVPAPRRRPMAVASAKKATSSPAGFPKVDGATQKSRDSDRKQILVDERKAEEQKLAGLKREYNNGQSERRGDERNYAKYQERAGKLKDDIDRSEKNIEALNREIGNLK